MKAEAFVFFLKKKKKKSDSGFSLCKTETRIALLFSRVHPQEEDKD